MGLGLSQVLIPYRGKTARNRINHLSGDVISIFLHFGHLSIRMTSTRTGIFVWFVHRCILAPRTVLGTQKALNKSIQLLNEGMNSLIWWPSSCLTWQIWETLKLFRTSEFWFFFPRIIQSLHTSRPRGSVSTMLAIAKVSTSVAMCFWVAILCDL